MTNAKDLDAFLKKNMANRRFIVALQREPSSHIYDENGGVKVQRSAGGVHVLLDSVLRETGGTVVAMASGNADKEVVDENNKVTIETDSKPYTLKRIFLKPEEYEGFYYGFANQTLWPLFHVVFVKPIFNPQWWNKYVTVNRIFAEAILSEIGSDEDAAVWVNDYQLALVPKMLHEVKPKLAIGTFWHIPWPTHEIFRICPWRREILEGMLGSDFISFHRDYHVDNFVSCARRELGLMVESEPTTVIRYGHRTQLANLPAGIDFDEVQKASLVGKEYGKEIIKNDFGFDTEYMAIGVERVEYTKGLVERLKILEVFFEKYPEYHGRFTYLSIAPPSRIQIPAYKEYSDAVFGLVEKINKKYGTSGWKPLHFVNKNIPRERLFAYYRLSDICLVTSLDDGMNLVAKEFVLACNPKKSMLLLSKFTGAAKDLRKSMLINPYDTEGSANALFEALTMDPAEKLKRNEEMVQVLKELNIYQWAIRFLQATIRANEDE